MITKEKLEIYKYYHGDVDDFGRGQKTHKDVMSDNDFVLIRNLIQNITIIKNKLDQKHLKLRQRMLFENCDDVETINKLKSIEII